MGDFLLDFRPLADRRSDWAAASLQFMDHIRSVVMDEPLFGLVLTLDDDAALWGPFRDPDGSLVALAGRVCLSEEQWQAGEMIPGPGGLASKAVYQLYLKEGVRALERLSGNCVVLVHDARRNEFHLVTDCAGAFPAFRLDRGQTLIFGSHPDVLAAVAGERNGLDEVSMAEFVLTSTVTPPFTYYQRVRALDHATAYTVHTTAEKGPKLVRSQRYFDFTYEAQPHRTEADLAAELAAALRNAVRRRTSPRFGRTAVALSGGLDSRAILACVDNKASTFAFTCFHEENREFRIAKAIAQALDVQFLPWRRSFDYYGDNAELGVKISGGMGTFANNHFLGIVQRLRAEGARNLLTGCYCDYLFKGLPLNRRRNGLSRTETLAPFRHQFYFDHRLWPTALANQARERWESRVPLEIQSQDSVAKIFQVESLRTFPLCYEGDNQQRLVPQRVSGWYLPVADRGLLEVYRRLPYDYKLNCSVFTKAVLSLCGGPLAAIPDANTGVRPGAPPWQEFLSVRWMSAARKLRQFAPSISADGSWPDWQYYFTHSGKLEQLWERPNPDAFDFFRKVLGPENFRTHMAAYRGGDVFVFVSLLTLKLWLEQRA